MSQESEGFAAQPRSPLLHLRLFPVVLCFALLLVAPAPARPRPLPKPDYQLEVSGLPKVLCAGQSYDVNVTVRGTPMKKYLPPRLSATIDNTDVATLDKPSSGSEEDDLPALPQARSKTVTVYALKPGKATLTLSSVLSKKFVRSNLAEQLIEVREFEVLNCDYTLDLRYTITLDDPLGYSDASGGMEQVKLRLDPETLKISGRGVVTSGVTGGWNTGGEECLDDPADVTSRVAIGGQLNGEQLELQLYFLPTFFSVIRRCARIELSGAKNPMAPQTATVSLFGPIPHLDVSIAPDGLPHTFPGIYPPAPHLTGETTIQVAPVESVNQ